MKNRIVTFLFLFLTLSCIFILRNSKADVVKSKYFNYVEKGAKTVKTSPSTQYKLMETYPQATVTVYNAGTTDLATLWSDKDGLIIKANPFSADTDSFYYFYVDCGKYDIKFSGTGIASPYTYGDVSICGNANSGTGNVTTLGGTEDFITKFTSSTSIGDSSLYNPSNVQASSTTLFGWTNGLPTASIDVAFGRNTAGKIEINSGTLGLFSDLTLHRIEPIPTVTIPGLNFGPIATDPTNPVAGDCWYNTSSNQFKCFNGTVIVILETGNGIETINALSAANQFLVVGSSGTDFNITSSTATHTFNIPSASLSNRGLVTTGSQQFAGKKTFTPTSTLSGFNFGILAGDPSSPTIGDCWYNTSLNKYRCFENSTVVNMITGLTLVAKTMVYSDANAALVSTSAPTNGQLLIGSTGNIPALGNITGTSPIVVTNGSGSIDISCPTCGSGGGSGGTCEAGILIMPFVTDNINGNQNNYQLSGTENQKNRRLTSVSGNITITGFIAAGQDGVEHTLINVDSVDNITIPNQSASSSAINRVITSTGSDIVLAPNQGVDMVYDSTSQRWRAFKRS